MKKFKFRLSDETSIDQPEVVFTAVLNGYEYCVEWVQEGVSHETTYGEESVKKFVDEGDWIILY